MTLFDQIQTARENIQKTLDSAKINNTVTLIAATKTQNIKTIEKCINGGILHVGENRVQEAIAKFKNSHIERNTCTKRMIGHLQSNKINKALSFFDTIDSIDTLSLAKKISTKSEAKKIKIQTMLEVNTSQEQNKFGFKPEDDQAMLETIELKNINVVGLMTLGPINKKPKETELSFKSLRKIKENLNKHLPGNKQLKELSMGMSGDYELAIHQGSTMVRLGTALFGQRV